MHDNLLIRVSICDPVNSDKCRHIRKTPHWLRGTMIDLMIRRRQNGVYSRPDGDGDDGGGEDNYGSHGSIDGDDGVMLVAMMVMMMMSRL